MEKLIGNLGELGSSSVNTRKSNASRSKKVLAAKVMLTSLIDAFSILVIYLLFNFSTTSEILYIGKGIELPMAQKTDDLLRNIVVKVQEDKIFVEDKEVSMNDLTKELVGIMKLRRENLHAKSEGEEEVDESLIEAITIQADRRVGFKRLSPIIQASGHAGFSSIHFAVLKI